MGVDYGVFLLTLWMDVDTWVLLLTMWVGVDTCVLLLTPWVVFVSTVGGLVLSSVGAVRSAKTGMVLILWLLLTL